jgi:DNA invertase Pin-like site-specific DNA recombinase
MATRPNQTSPMHRAGIYTRISWDPDGNRAGVERQRVDCEFLCVDRGWDIAQHFEDNDRSAYSGKRRPAYERLLAAVEERRLDAIVTWHNDRLHRSPRELEAFIDLVEQSGVRVAVVSGGDYDLTTPEGRFTARIVGAVARKESEDRSRRVRRKHLELAEQGRPASHLGWGVRTRPSVNSSGRRPVGFSPAKHSSPSLVTGTGAASRGRQPHRGRRRRCGRSSPRRGSPAYGSTARTHAGGSWAC